MRFSADDYVKVPCDSPRSRDLVRELRKIPEAERFAFVKDLLPLNLILGLDLATRCLSNKEYFKAVLDWGLDRGDASSIRVWLSCVIPKLGARRVLLILKEEIHKRPKAVSMALYWLPSLIGNDEESRTLLKELRQLVKAEDEA
jgi:hypothetical protein